MLRAVGTSSQPAANIPLPRQSGGAKPMACSRPSSRPQRVRQVGRGRRQLLGRRDVDLEHVGLPGSLRAVRRVSDSARPAPERTISAPSSWARRATAKASDASVSTPVTRIRLPSRSPTALG